MADLILAWTDVIYDLQDALDDHDEPIYIVGGAVRDALMRRPLKDLDITVQSGGIALARTIANRLRGDFYALDSERDVGRALVDTPEGKLIIDVSAFRAGDLEADLRDRDFTINAMAVNLLGDLNNVIDPTGGVNDLITKLIRRCSPDAITHDPIRALRAVRQSVQFGFRIDADTLHDIRAHAERLHEVSAERVRDEFFKLLSLPRPAAALRIADKVGLLGVIVPEVIPLHGLHQPPPHIFNAWEHTLSVIEVLNDILSVISPRRTDETAAQFNLGLIAIGLDRFRARLQAHLERPYPEGRTRRDLLIFGALLHDIGKGTVTPKPDQAGALRYFGHAEAGVNPTHDRAAALKLSSAERELLTALVQHHMMGILWRESLTDLDMYRYWRATGEAGIDLILLMLADFLGAFGVNYPHDEWVRAIEHAQRLMTAYYDEHDRLVNPPALLRGDELMRALGLQAGRQIGELLERIREGQVTGEIVTVEDALRVARQALPNGHQ